MDRLSRVTIIGGLLAAAGPVAAQNVPVTSMPPMPPAAVSIDRNGVDISQDYGKVDTLPSIQIGNQQASLEEKRFLSTASYQTGMLRFQLFPQYNGGWLIARAASRDGRVHVFSLGTIAVRSDWGTTYWDFFPTGTATPNSAPDVYSSVTDDGSLLICSGYPTAIYRAGTCSLTLADGSKTNFSLPDNDFRNPLLMWNSSAVNTVDTYYSSIEMADGEIISAQANHIDTSLGFRIYTLDPTTLAAINLSQEYQDPLNQSPSLSSNALSSKWVTTTGANYDVVQNGVKQYSVSRVTASDPPSVIIKPSGRTTTYGAGDGTADSGSPAAEITLTRTRQVTNGGKVTIYSYGQMPGYNQPGNANIAYWRYLNPDGSKELYRVKNGFIEWKVDGLGRTTIYNYEGLDGVVWGFNGLAFDPRLTRIVRPDSPTLQWNNGLPSVSDLKGSTSYSYTHGTVSQITETPIDGSPALVTQYGITLTCTAANYKVCNKPQYKIDARGNQTDYTYSTAHGGALTETLPADANGVRPQKRFGYTQLYPKILNSSGVLVNSTPVWRVTSVSECMSATAANPASCVGTAAERVTTYVYNHPNLFLTSTTVAAGDGSNSSTIAYTYDYAGNVTSVDGPRTDVNDVSYTTYDAMRRPVFEIGIDPDGAGSLPRQIVKHSYDVDGNETLTEIGTGTATNGSDFSAKSAKRRTYDPVTGLVSKLEEVEIQP